MGLCPSPHPPSDLPAPQPLFPSPYWLSFPLKPSQSLTPCFCQVNIHHPQHTVSGRQDGCGPAVSPGWVHNRCSACVWGWMKRQAHLDRKNNEHVTLGPHPGSRAIPNQDPAFTSYTAASTASGGGRGALRAPGWQKTPFVGAHWRHPRPWSAPQDQAHSQLCLSTCMAVSTPPPPH